MEMVKRIVAGVLVAIFMMCNISEFVYAEEFALLEQGEIEIPVYSADTYIETVETADLIIGSDAVEEMSDFPSAEEFNTEVLDEEYTDLSESEDESFSQTPEFEETELQEARQTESNSFENEDDEDFSLGSDEEDFGVELMGILYFTGRYKVVGSSAVIRTGYSSEYAEDHRLAKGKYLDIVEVYFNWSTFHYWGKTRQGRWTCLDNGNVERVSGIVSNGKKYTIKSGVTRRKGPSSGYGSKSAKAGEIITATETHYNDFGNAWYKISGGGTYCYIYSGDVTSHSCSYSAVQTSTKYKPKNDKKHTKFVTKTASTCSCGSVKSKESTTETNYDHSYNLGYCKTCDYEFPLQYNKIKNKYYQVKSNDTPIRKVPYSEQKAYKYYSAGKVVIICQSTTNCKNSLWYKTKDGDWIYSGNLDKHSHNYENGLCTNSTCKHVKEFTTHNMNSTMYEIVQSKVELKDRPYGSETTTKKTVSGKGTIIKIVGYCYNQYWNKWYLTSDGYWVWEDYVDKHTKHNYSAGVCTNSGCGTEFKYEEKTVNKQYVTNQSNVAARVKPYSNTGGTRTLTKDYVVTVKTKAKNSAGNWWYKTDKGDWIYSERMDKHKHSYSGGVCKFDGCGNVYNLDIDQYKKAKTLYTNKQTVYARKSPYETGGIGKTYDVFGTGVTINAEVKNAVGNKWYRTSDNLWIYDDNLSSHKHTFTEDSEGKCSKLLCGYEWPYKVVSITPTSYYIISDSAPMWKRPYADSGKKDTKSKNDIITIVAKTTNYFGNLWYKDSRGIWIAAKHADLKKGVKPADNDSGGKVEKNTYVLSVVNTSRSSIEGATVYFGDAGGVKTDKNGQVKLDYTKASTYLKITASGYETYEISSYTMSSLKRDTIILGKAEKCEITKAELSYNNQVIDVLKTTQQLNRAVNNVKFSLKCFATSGKVSNYVLKQDKTIVAESSDGNFKSLYADKFKKDKDVYLYVYDSSEKELAKRKLMLDIVYQLGDVPFEFSIGSGVSVKLPDSAPWPLSGMKLELPEAKVPIEASYDVSGNIKLGVNFDPTKCGKTWEEIKSMGAKKFAKWLDTSGMKLPPDNKYNKVSSGVNFSTVVGGYIEGNIHKFDTFTGKIIIVCSAGVWAEFQVPSAPVPMIVELSIEGKASANGSIIWSVTSGFEWSTGLNLELSLGLFGGIGVKGVFSAGFYGTGTVGADFALGSKVKASLASLYLTGNMGVKVKLLGNEIFKWQALNLGKYYIIQNGVSLCDAGDEFYDPLFMYNLDGYQIMDRSYLEKRSGWYPDSDISLMEETTENSGEENAVIAADYEFHKLQMNSYTDIRPQVVSLDNLSMMLYVDDDAQRDAHNRTKLVYSVYNDDVGMWSEPKSVHDDLTADYIFDVMSDGENVFVVWQNAKKLFDGTESITDISMSTDLYIAKYDVEADAFANVERITDNEKYELMPSVSHGNDKIIVSWLENGNDDVFGREGENTVKYAVKSDDEYPQSELIEETNGGESATDNPDSDESEEPLNPDYEIEGDAEYDAWINTAWNVIEYELGEQYVTSMSAGNLYEFDYIAYTVDGDGDYMTNEDQTIFLLSLEDNTSEGLTDKASNAEFVQIHGDNTLTWYNGGRIYYLVEPGYAPQIICEESVVPSDEYHILTDDNGDMVILYTLSTKTGSDAYMLKYEDITYEWGLPIKITDQDLHIKNFNGAYKNGKIIGVFNQISVDDQMNENNTLCTVTIGERHDLKVVSIDYDEASLNIGENDIGVEIQNNGNIRVSSVIVRVYNEAEELVSEEIVDVNLRIGDTATVDTKIVIPDEIKKTTFKVCVEEPDVMDEKTSDNYEFFTVGLPILKTELSSYVTDEETVITVNVSNDGYDEASGSIALYNEDGSIYQIVCENIEALDKGDVYTYSFVIESDYFEDDMYKNVIVGVIPDTEQYSDAYNKASIYLKNPKEYENVSAEVVMEDTSDSSEDDDFELMEANGNQLTSVITNTTESDIENAQICVVAYDERGVFVDIIYIEDISVGVGESHKFSFDCDMDSTKTIKIMLLDKDTLLPLIEPTVISEEAEEHELVVDESIMIEEEEY